MRINNSTNWPGEDMFQRAPGRHRLRVILLVCLFPWSGSTDSVSGAGDIHTETKGGETVAGQQQTATEQQHIAGEGDHSHTQDSDVEDDENDDVIPRHASPKRKDKRSFTGHGVGPSATEDFSSKQDDVDTGSEQERENPSAGSFEEPSIQPGHNNGESDHNEQQGGRDVGGGVVGTDRSDDPRVQVRERYRRELQEQRERLMHQQTLEQEQLQQQLEQEDRDSEDDGDKDTHTTSKTLLAKERQRLLHEQKLLQLLQQQRQRQQQQWQDREGGEEVYESERNLDGHAESLYDSGREPDTEVGGGRSGGDSGEPGDDSDSGEPGAGGEGGVRETSELGAGGDGVKGEAREGGEVESGEESEENTCDPETPGDCPEVKEDVYHEGMKLVLKKNPQLKEQGYVLLKEAAESGHTRALEQLAYAHLIGSVVEMNFTWSFEKFSALAEVGNPIGQQGLGFMYSTGIGVNSSQAKALLYYTFAALGGHHFSQMTMGYRSLMGVSVAQSCETALYYYQKAAKKVVDEVTIVTGGLLISKVRLMEEDNEASNVYGVSEDDMIHYHDVFTDSGNTGAQVLLGVYYMFGMAGAERSFKMALRFLEGAAREGFAAANALIGKMYAEGSDEVPRDYAAAMKYFQKAKDMGHADGYSGVGMLYFFAMGVEQDYAYALELFQKAADKGSSEAQYYLGHMHHEGYGTKRNLNKALRYFQLASHGGHILAIYSLAEMHAEGRAVKRNCNYAVELFKGVSERGQWTRMLEEAERSYEEGDIDSALMKYLLMAELGLEVAQTNAAYILEQEGLNVVSEKETLKRALILWNRSASQGYVMARVKLGDYYYYGQGTDINYEAAASQYRIASDKQSSALAMFNLAYMYQQGYGLEKDYHLAKRYYDLAAETSGEANVPVTLALMNLNLLYYFDCLQHVMLSPVVTKTVSRVEAVAGENWDMYLITLLSGLLALVFMWRWRH